MPLALECLPAREALSSEMALSISPRLSTFSPAHRTLECCTIFSCWLGRVSVSGNTHRARPPALKRCIPRAARRSKDLNTGLSKAVKFMLVEWIQGF